MSPESRLPARSVLLLRRVVHWTPAPSKAAGAIYPFSGSKNLPLNDSKPTACLCLLKAKLLTIIHNSQCVDKVIKKYYNKNRNKATSQLRQSP